MTDPPASRRGDNARAGPAALEAYSPPEARTSARTHEGDPLAVADDLAELRRIVGERPDALAALDRVEAALLAARRARATLLSDLSHELRTPLGAILGFLHLLRQDGRLLGEQRAHVEVIHRSSEQLLALIDELTDADDRGPVQVCDLHHLLDELADMLCLRAAGAGVALRFERQAGLPRLVRVDPLRLRQLLLLLIGNVVAAPRDDAVVVQVQVDHQPGEAAGIFRCRISAPGLLAGDLELRDFVRTGAGLQAQDPLDLAATHLQPLGGGLHVAPGQLYLDLPVGLGAAPPPRPPTRLPTLVPDHPELRILVAEDRWQGRHLLVHTLERAGFSVREAADGREALRLWETWRPHLVWMDMRMPIITGIEATRQIKQSPRGADTVVIALTASAFEADEATARAAGCDDFLRKPLRLDQVFAMLAAHLGARYQDDAPAARAAAPGPAALAGLPEPWLVALQQASVQADLGAIQRMIDSVRPQAPRAASVLMDMLDQYDYAAIIDLARHALQSARGST